MRACLKVHGNKNLDQLELLYGKADMKTIKEWSINMLYEEAVDMEVFAR